MAEAELHLHCCRSGQRKCTRNPASVLLSEILLKLSSSHVGFLLRYFSPFGTWCPKGRTRQVEASSASNLEGKTAPPKISSNRKMMWTGTLQEQLWHNRPVSKAKGADSITSHHSGDADFQGSAPACYVVSIVPPSLRHTAPSPSGPLGDR